MLTTFLPATYLFAFYAKEIFFKKGRNLIKKTREIHLLEIWASGKNLSEPDKNFEILGKSIYGEWLLGLAEFI